MDFINHLLNPPRAYTPMPFWFLNDRLDHETIRQQIQGFRDKGIYGFVLHPRIGLPDDLDYLSEAFFSYLRTAIEAAKENDMHVVLYDEGMYPSGSACGLVVKDHPELASVGIALTSSPLKSDIVLAGTDAGFLVERPSGGTIRGIHFGEDDGEPNAPPSADILNPAAVARFISLTHEAYFREFAPDFGRTIIGFFTDEPSILGRNTRGLFPWTRGFARIFEDAGGCTAGLAGLFTGEENDDTALYRRLILKRECDVYYAALSSWCESHGIALMGHPHQSDDIELERFFHIPGQDLVLRWIAPEKGDLDGMDTVMAKCSADMARLTGRSRNSSECFGACGRPDNPWHLTGADLKWYIDYLAVRGVNLFIPHAFYYSLRDRRSGERPPDVGPGSIWWPSYKNWSSYMGRLSCLMAESSLKTDIAVLCRNREMHADAVAPLFASQRSFQYIPESIWNQCREENGRLVCCENSYRAVLGPGSLFPSVSHDPFSVPPDCLCTPPAPSLRTARLEYDGHLLWFLVNAGPDAIETDITLPASGAVLSCSLWSGSTSAVPCRQVSGGILLHIRLEQNDSRLLIVTSPDDASAYPVPSIPSVILREDAFQLQAHNALKLEKIYEAVLPGCTEQTEIRVNADEMVRMTVCQDNHPVECGISYWSPHIFRVPEPFLNGRPIRIRLTVTGSLANQYGSPVFYGLRLCEEQ